MIRYAAEFSAPPPPASRQHGSALGVAVFGALLGPSLISGLHVSLILGAGSVLATVFLSIRYIAVRTRLATS